MKTVRELIEELQQYPPHYKVVISSDPEGNDFHAFVDTGHGRFDQDWREFTSWTCDDDDVERAMTLDEADTVCLWP